MKERIATIIVTYNRKKLLLETLKSVLEQTLLPDTIFVIDNASTDGTPDVLLKRGYIKELPPQHLKEPWEYRSRLNFLEKPIEFIYIRLPQNTGGAGGFHEGIKRAYQQNYNWFWLMDDDGIPSKTCLETLYRFKDKALWISPLVVNKDNPNELFTWINYPKISSKSYIKTVEEAKQKSKNGILENISTPFNGVLINRQVIDIIGNVKKELFIWGDEIDFLLRALSQNIRIITVVDALFYHPKNKVLLHEKPILFGLTSVRVLPDYIRMYYRIRNRTYLYKTYWNIFSPWVSMKVLIKDFIKLFWYYTFTTKDFKGLKNFLKAFFDGLKF
jgi:rhamnopyranosyl-N-acetylglucosaminyl-diphospho-decaprenol beta-1,3/1,4-galactofuranosyltransferase